MRNYTIDRFKLSGKLNEDQFIKVLILPALFMLINKQMKWRQEVEILNEFAEIHWYSYLLYNGIVTNELMEMLQNYENPETWRCEVSKCMNKISDELLFLNNFDRMQILSLIEFIVGVKWEWGVWLKLLFTITKSKLENL
jgi:hypothetical protein